MGRPKKKHAGGRPTLMTEKTIQKLEEAFGWGCTDLEACLHADIKKSTLYKYQIANPEFVERKEMLKENPVRLARESVVRALPEDKNLAFAYLKARKKDEFGDKLTIDGDLTVNVIKFSDSDSSSGSNSSDDNTNPK